MSETFYGPWSVAVIALSASYQQRFTIQGSDNSNGSFPGTVGTQVARVDGVQWSLNLEWSNDNGLTWHDSEVRRTDEVTSADGYVVKLGADDNFPQLRDHDFNDVVLSMKCLDPDINPPPSGNYYDFTISRDWLTGGGGHV